MLITSVSSASFFRVTVSGQWRETFRNRATLIRRFDGSTFLLSPKAKKGELRIGTHLEEVKAKIKQLGWIIAIEHLHGEVPTQTVSFKELVTNAYVGDTIELEASGYRALEKTVTYQVVVRYAEPGKRIFTRVFRTEKVVETVNGIFKEQLEGGYKFEKHGTYQFVFKVWKPRDVLAGKAMTRTVIVRE